MSSREKRDIDYIIVGVAPMAVDSKSDATLVASEFSRYFETSSGSSKTIEEEGTYLEPMFLNSFRFTDVIPYEIKIRIVICQTVILVVLMVLPRRC